MFKSYSDFTNYFTNKQSKFKCWVLCDSDGNRFEDSSEVVYSLTTKCIFECAVCKKDVEVRAESQVTKKKRDENILCCSKCSAKVSKTSIKDRKDILLDEYINGSKDELINKFYYYCGEKLLFTNIEYYYEEKLANDYYYKTLMKELKEYGWSMLSRQPKEKSHSKTDFLVEYPSGHIQIKSEHSFGIIDKNITDYNSGCMECYNNYQKNDISSVRKTFEEKGLTLVSTNYINNKSKLQYICHCGQIKDITYSGLLNNVSGCLNCSRSSRKAEWNDILLFANNNNCQIISDKSEYQNNYISKLKFICKCGNEDYKTWHTFNSYPFCKNCATNNKIEACIKKYGVRSVFELNDIKEKIRETLLKKYNVMHNMQVKEIRDKAQIKAKETNIRNHGGVHNLTLPEVRKKAVASGYALKSYIFDSGKEIFIRGYEKFAINDLVKEGITEDDIVVEGIPSLIYFYDKPRRYHPDIYVKSKDLTIEVKSEYTFNVKYEFNMNRYTQIGNMINFVIWIYNDKGKRVQEIKFDNTIKESNNTIKENINVEDDILEEMDDIIQECMIFETLEK